MPKKIVDLVLNEAELLSIVDKGASGNEKVSPRILLIKRKGCGYKRPERKKAMTPEERQATLDEMRARLGDELFAVLMSMLEPEPAAPPPEEPIVQADGEPPPDEEDEMQKRLPAHVREQIAKGRKAEQQAAELSKRLARVESEMRERVMLEKVRKEMPHIPGLSHEQTAKMVAAAQTAMDGADFALLEKAMKACSAAIGTSEVLKAQGTAGEVAGSAGAYQKLREIAKRISREDKISVPAALLKAAEQNPELWTEYRVGE